MSMKIFVNGEFLEASEAKISVFDHGFLYGDGVYDTLRTFGGKLFQPKEHLDRFLAAAEYFDLPLSWSREEILGLMEKGIELNDFEETRLRIMLTRGVNDFRVGEVKKATLVILFSPLVAAGDAASKGIKAVTSDVERAVPDVKTISMAPVMLARGEMEQQDAAEVFLVNRDGYVTEGSISNIFMVEDGEVLTPGEDMLEGTVRNLVIEWVKEKGSVSEENITSEDLYNADEIFVTNSIWGVMPVLELDGEKIGDGEPGKFTLELMERFKNYVAVDVEDSVDE